MIRNAYAPGTAREVGDGGRWGRHRRAQQQPPSQPPGQPPDQPPPLSSTRPPEDNEKGLRPLTPEEIPPNLNFYAMDPLYKAGTPLGWATERIRETLDRGLVAIVAQGADLLELAAARHRSARACAFNVYRTTAAGDSEVERDADRVDDRLRR